MLFHKRGADVVDEYIIEGYRRLYANSCDKDGYSQDFDSILMNAMMERYRKKLQKIEIPYENFYCPDKVQLKILAQLVNEPYITFNQKTGNPVYHKLKSYEANTVKNTVVMGVSPWSSFSSFAKKNTNFAKYKDYYKDDLHEYYD